MEASSIDFEAHRKRMAMPSNVLVVDLEGIVEGIEVNYPSSMWTGHKNKYTYDPTEYQGILFRGTGTEGTVIVGNGIANSVVHIGEGNVYFKNLSIEADEENLRTGIITSWAGGPNVHLGLVDVKCYFKKGRWGLFLYNTDDFAIGCEFWGAQLGEHVRYGHGFAQHGSFWSYCVVHDSGAENWKQANRPEESTRWYRDQMILIEDCKFGGWHQPHSGMGGGVVCQGTSANIVVKRCWFDGPTNVYTKALMVDDGYGEAPHHGARFYDIHTGQPQEKFATSPDACANGWVIVEECGFSGHGSQYYSPMVRVGPMQPNVPHSTARGFQLLRCGVYGLGTKVELSEIENDNLVQIVDCNTDVVKAHMRRAGYPAQVESQVQHLGRWEPASENYMGVDVRGA